MLPINTPIWIPDGPSGYVEGLVLEEFKPGQPAKVLLVKTQTEATLPPNVSKSVERRVVSSVDSDPAPNDLSSLIHLSRASLLEALRLRHEANKVYTSVGPILVSVNPYKTIPDLYTEAKRRDYFDFNEKDPHVYETATRAFIGATKNHQDQSIIFSGESGAGKTFATRVLTEFLVYASSRSESRSAERALVQQRLQAAQPMIEAFGNAKTSRNDNSSRFGCWTEIEFSGNEICGASVTGFNLEKSRVCIAGRGASEDLKQQRNFHVFYQIAAANAKLHAREFRYLGFGKASEKFTETDMSAFHETIKSMEALELGAYAAQVLEIVEGVLELGNVEFTAKEDPVTRDESCTLADRAQLERACDLLGGMDVDEVERGLLQRDVSNPKESIWRPHTKAQAEEARDALAKHIYGRLFDWLLVKVNEATSSLKKKEAFSAGTRSGQQGIIGLLDTYGFEIFATNSFEQLCINYCNERIMSAFNETCIKAEHELYANEGLILKLSSNDETSPSTAEPFLDRSKICLELLEATPGGVFSLLDDEIKVPKGSDLQYLSKLRDFQKGHTNFIPYVSTLKDSKAKFLFGIVHFAGTVHYCVEDFVEKNRDTLHAQLDRTCAQSDGFLGQFLFAQELFSLSSSPKKTPKGKKVIARSTSATQASQKTSLGTRFRLQLNDLMNRIGQTQTHFVRCIKPNDFGTYQFQGNVVLEQLNYGGVLETCRLRKDGFQVRRSHDDFLATYGVLSNGKSTTAHDLAKELQERYGLDCQVGKTTAFLKAEDFNKLEKALVERENAARVTVQSFARLVIERQKHSKRKVFLDKLKHALDKLDEARIRSLVDESALEVFPKGNHEHIPLVRKAKQTLAMLAEEKLICDELNMALSCSGGFKQGLADLEKAVAKAEKLDHDLRGHVASALSEARAMLDKWRAEKAASDAKNREVMREAKSGSALLMLQRAVKKFLYARRVKKAFKQLREAVQSKNMDLCMKAVRRMSDLGLRNHPEVLAAAKMLPERKKKTKQLEKAMAELAEAVDVARFKTARIKALRPEDVAVLTHAINNARMEGCEECEIQDAIDLERDMLTAVAANSAKRKWWMCCCTGAGVAANVAANDVDIVAKPKKYV